MAASGGNSSRLKATFRLPEAPTLVIRSLNKTEIAVSDCWSDAPDGEISSGFPAEDAYIVGLQLRDYVRCEYWEDQRRVATTDVYAGQTLLYDVKRDPRFVMDKPFHMVGFYIPRAAFDTIADDASAPRIGELDYLPGIGRDDAVVRNLGGAMLSALASPEQASSLFADHVTLAVAAHVAHEYGGLRRSKPPVRGGLAGWQFRRACSMLDAHLDGGIPLRQIAAECGLSTGHFSRAFRQTAGMPPHAWLLHRRVEVAKSLMHDRTRSLADIALASGFADQCHFTRVFSKSVGISPRAWRRCLDIEPSHDAS